MKKESQEILRNWIQQFEPRDRPIANLLLNDLHTVTTNEFEDSLTSIIKSFFEKYSKVAIFPILEPALENRHKIPQENMPKFERNSPRLRRQAGSSKQISYFINRLYNTYPRSVAAEPTEESMEKEKIKCIIYVDDVINSGKRVVNFWHLFVSRKVKSWLSYNLCDVYFVSYSAMSIGISFICSKIKGASRNEFKFELNDPEFKNYDRTEYLCKKYITKKSNNACGYMGVVSNIIFEWKCPNNTPQIFWVSENWNPLFKNRVMDNDLFELIKSKRSDKIAERLWDAGQYKTAMSILNNITRLPRENINFISALGLLSKRVSLLNIKKQLFISNEELQNLLKKGKMCGAIGINNTVTLFGKELLGAFKKEARLTKRTVFFNENELLYLPSQYRGYSRI